jgi:hypothetical protein
MVRAGRSPTCFQPLNKVENRAEVRARIALVLKDFAAEGDPKLRSLPGHRMHPDRERFPVPELALFVLRDLLETALGI